MRRNLIGNSYKSFTNVKNKISTILNDPNIDPQVKKDAEIAEFNEDLNRLGNDFRLDVDQQHESEEKKEEIEMEHKKESKQAK